MCRRDIAQVTKIDHESFTNMWPPANFQRELENRIAHYIVACVEGVTVVPDEPKATPERSFLGLAPWVRRIFNHGFLWNETLTSTEYIAGFAGFWIMADEAHLTSIAVREQYRRRGIGELLLIYGLELAAELNAHIVTLEVRVSNTTAQNLYEKYGFAHVGLRRGYYTDNNEDAALMTVDDITSTSFQERLQQLKQAHSGRWGHVLSRISRPLTSSE
jgi:ribosomal-protein-alanine N-acetyltransferase